MDFKKFRELIKASFTHPMADIFATRLAEHGEVQVNMNNGGVFSIHQGDEGVMEPSYMMFRADTGVLYSINYDSIAHVWTHLGSKE